MFVLSTRICCGAGFDDARMAVADVRHVVVRVEVAAALVVVQILHPSAHDLHRIAIRDAEIAADVRARAASVSRRRRRRRETARPERAR